MFNKIISLTLGLNKAHCAKRTFYNVSGQKISVFGFVMACYN